MPASTAALRARRRQRALLSLLAHGDPKVPGALVVDYPDAAAYCVPGLRSRIVISAGALAVLDQAELAAVLAHERAHLRERHDLVLLPFTALRRAFPRSAAARQAHTAVALLVEMLADDHALRHSPALELVTALIRVGAAGTGSTPAGALAIGAQDSEVAARVARLLEPAPGLWAPALTLVGGAAVLLVAVPAGLLVFPICRSFRSELPGIWPGPGSRLPAWVKLNGARIGSNSTTRACVNGMPWCWPRNPTG